MAVQPRKNGVCHKLKLKWEGPYLVLKKLSDVVCRIQRSKGANLRVVHVDRLKPYRGNPIDPWDTVAVRDREENVVSDKGIQVESCDLPEQEDVNRLVTHSGDNRAPHPSHGTPGCGEAGRYPRRTHRLPLMYR